MSTDPEIISDTQQYADNPAYLEALDEVHTRFVLNLPDSELQTADRIFFQLEQAWWFYEDFICDRADASTADLPRFGTFRPFAEQLFRYSPLLPPSSKFNAMWNEFGKYKRKISNYGCILLNSDCTQIVLCQLWNSKTHTFPAGKINQGEDGMAAAARETYEETGFDPLLQFGLTSEWAANGESAKITWKHPFSEQDALVFQEDNGKRRVAYACHAVPHDFPFCPVVRKEISHVAFYPIDNLPKPSYAVTPFLNQLKKWIKKNTNTNQQTTTKQQQGTKTKNKTPTRGERTAAPTSRKKTPTRSSRGRSGSTGSRTSSRGRNVATPTDDVVRSGLAQAGDVSGWSEDEMFSTNERILGRKVEYDGNPHVFSERGFDGQQDPHAFHVVGGTFLNSIQAVSGQEGLSSDLLATAPPAVVVSTSKLQPLFRKQSVGEDEYEAELTPFFSSGGETPWGEVVPDVKNLTTTTTTISTFPSRAVAVVEPVTVAPPPQQQSPPPPPPPPPIHDVSAGDDIFMTDAQITAKSQATKTAAVATAVTTTTTTAEPPDVILPPLPASASLPFSSRREERRAQYEQDMEYVRNWVANLPKGRPTALFGEFKLDVDAIMAAAAVATTKSTAATVATSK